MSPGTAVWLLAYGLLQTILGIYIARRAQIALQTPNQVPFLPVFRLRIRLTALWYGKQRAEQMAAEGVRGWCYAWIFSGYAIGIGGGVLIVSVILRIVGG